jgi:hypothetical protein
MCTECGTKWFIHQHRVEEPDLTECGACGGALARFSDDPSDETGDDSDES